MSEQKNAQRIFDKGQILYRELGAKHKEDKAFLLMLSLMSSEETSQKLQADFYECFHSLVQIASACGFYGNLWHVYLAYLLAMHENPYSLACEITGGIQGSLNDAAMHDFAFLKEIYDYPIREVIDRFDPSCASFFLHYQGDPNERCRFSGEVSDRIVRLSKDLAKAPDVAAFKDCVTKFYGEYGVGPYGLHKAFRVLEEANIKGIGDFASVSSVIRPIRDVTDVHFDELVGYEYGSFSFGKACQ